MAAVVVSENLKQAAAKGAFAVGRKLYDGAAVNGLEPGYGGATAVVAGSSGREFDVWIGVAGGALAAECDCAAARRGAGLCAHAVAVGLAALDRQLPWAPAPLRDADGVDGAATLAALDAAEKADVLDRLLAAHPELRAEAEALAVQELDLPGAARRASGDQGYAELRDRTAQAVEDSLRDLDIGDMRTGRQPGYGYVEPYDAATTMVEDALEPFHRDVKRRLGLGMTGAAQAVGQGVLDGLRACEGEYDGDEVLCYASEDLEDSYGYTVRETLRKAGAALPEED